ncbi:lysozyme inhibitor LprI family protein [Pseudomonas sp. PDM31]|uniref:lysozyme inhibitor LprI family protein n=1 Tax=Pseudomonas sp. PDM31 TaxID=2854778 RepID=UPI001C467626|nr:lysozyme inhibitor LprI family protein [Pseudomonas sp. PDM31]MBV7476782.1 DUF1311 domain-containing protein [Pseudomonas sp. PDM31]
MRLLALTFCAISYLWISPAFADGNCNKNSFVTKDILQCADVAYKKIDKKLTEQYSAMVANSEFSHENLLLDSERAWIQYKAVHCENVYVSVSPGEEAEIEKVACLTSLTVSRVMELLYLDTGVNADGFYNALSVMAGASSVTREKIFSHIENLTSSPEEARYYRKNCELVGTIHAEEERICQIRMKFQAIAR